MSILPPLLFGISASLDALLVGMALGLQKVPLPARHNLLISTVTLIGTVISIGLGNLLLPLYPIGIGTRIGSSVLILSFRHRCPPFSAPSDFWLSEAVWAGLLSCSRSGNIRIPSQVYC